MKERLFSNRRFIIEAAVLLLLILCSVAVITQVISLAALPASFIGAALGAVITGLMTAILLKGQTASQEEKERNVKIFELKKDAFNKYINKVWDIWEDNKVDDNGFETLCSEYYRNIAIYLDEDKSKAFVEYLIEIGMRIGSETEENYRIIKRNIFEIINLLVDDLGLGGSVDQKQHENLEKELFPGFFRKAIATEVYKVLKEEFNCIMEGKYESVYYDDTEYLCFYLDTTKKAGSNCTKFIIGPFKGGSSNVGKICFDLYIEPNLDLFPNKENIAPIAKYRQSDTRRWEKRLIKTMGRVNAHIYKAIDDKDDSYQEPFELDFRNTEELRKKYGIQYQKVAEVIAKRVRKFIETERIIEKDIEGNDTKTELSYIEFLKKVELLE